jgi:predicted amidohydrolase YtcJ
MALTLFRGGTVVTADPAEPFTDALAMAEDRIVAVGADAEALSADATGTVDLDGRALLPGFRDGHAHPYHAGVEEVGLSLAGARSLDEVRERIRAYADAHPDEAWIHGGGYEAALLPGAVGEAVWLDEVVRDRPVALESNDHHMLWVNSRAMELAGVSAATPEPADGVVVRRGDGTPVGTFIEWGAVELVLRHVPDPPPERQRAGMARGLAELAAEGIVWVQDASVDLDDAARYVAMAERGDLSCRVNLAYRVEPSRWPAQVEAFAAHRHTLEADPACAGRLTGQTVKFFADGVIEGGTGFLLEPYEDAPHSCGLPNWAPAELVEAAVACDAAGFQIHIHAIGDGGVRMALDAVEAAQRRNGPRDRRPVIAHTQLVHPDDWSRFAALGVIANFEPLWACLDDTMVRLTVPRLGPARSALQYPIATLARAGARISFGSDWPVTSLRPLDGLAVAVSRQTPAGDPAGGWLPEERLPIHDAVAAYTSGSAHQAFDDTERGRLAPGKAADLCLVDLDITAVAGREVSGARVLGTWLDGREVFRAGE